MPAPRRKPATLKSATRPPQSRGTRSNPPGKGGTPDRSAPDRSDRGRTPPGRDTGPRTGRGKPATDRPADPRARRGPGRAEDPRGNKKPVRPSGNPPRADTPRTPRTPDGTGRIPSRFGGRPTSETRRQIKKPIRRRDIAKRTAHERRMATQVQPEAGERLQKAMAAAGVGSRRLCEQFIEAGRVKVNGRPVTQLPAWVDPQTDTIEVDGQPLVKPERHVYVMLYKPRHTVSTMTDPDGRKTVSDIVQHPSGARLYPVGRLDYDTMGLLLLTNDGELANRLTHPRFGVHKTYRALVRGSLTPEKVADLEKRIALAERKEGEHSGGAKLVLVKSAADRSVIDITLTEGRNRQVRLMLAKVGFLVRKLVRISMGPIRLKSVALGQWRELTREELRDLRQSAKLESPTAISRAAPRKPAKRGGVVSDDGGARFHDAGGDEEGVNLILPPEPVRPVKPRKGAKAEAPAAPRPKFGAADDEFIGDDVW